ncbi:MAG TPA: tetratricopeptide repeat protein [Pyrinomonadaceae bacterium]|jgi:Tfp pilus assembly protein PilF
MKTGVRRMNLFVIASIVLLFSVHAARAQNSISGIIFDADRRPVPTIDVELLDEFERLLRTTKTTTSGLYIFQGLGAGTYYVQVKTFGTNFRETKERVQIGQTNRTSSTGKLTGSESLQINFTLQFQRRDDAPLNNEVVLAQNVPREAEKHFENALKKLKDRKSDEALMDLENALRVFPEYFLALEKIGYEYLAKGRFADAENAFARALAVNAKSFSAKSGLGIAEYKLGNLRDAVKTLEESLVLNQSSANSFLFLGKIHRELKEFEKAEANLKKAKELAKNKLADVHWELALLYYYSLNRPRDAANELELYLKAKPDADKSRIEKLIKAMREKAKEKS